jgi:hypothetical protein
LNITGNHKRPINLVKKLLLINVSPFVERILVILKNLNLCAGENLTATLSSYQ